MAGFDHNSDHSPRVFISSDRRELIAFLDGEFLGLLAESEDDQVVRGYRLDATGWPTGDFGTAGAIPFLMA